MSKREFAFQPREIIRPVKKTPTRTIQQRVKSIEFEESDTKLKITTDNGTRCDIALKNYKDAEKQILLNCLIEGDLIKMELQAGKVIQSRVDISSEKYKLEDVQRFKHDLYFTFRNEQKEEEIKLCNSDIADKKIVCLDANGVSSWFDLYCARWFDVLGIEVQLYCIGERMVCIEFGMLQKN